MTRFSAPRVAILFFLAGMVACSGVLVSGDEQLVEELELFAKTNDGDDPLEACAQLKEACETHGNLCKAYEALCVVSQGGASDAGPPPPAGDALAPTKPQGTDETPYDLCKQKEKICEGLSVSCEVGGTLGEKFCSFYEKWCARFAAWTGDGDPCAAPAEGQQCTSEPAPDSGGGACPNSGGGGSCPNSGGGGSCPNRPPPPGVDGGASQEQGDGGCSGGSCPNLPSL